MFNLIKNELIKIFSKKAIYIILIIFLILSIAGATIMKIIENFDFENNYIDQQISFINDSLKDVNRTTEKGKEEYSFLQSQIEYFELQKKYGTDSWQASIVSEELYDVIVDINYYKNGLTQYVAADTLPEEELQKKYNDTITKLDAGDWRAFAEQDLRQAERQTADIVLLISNETDRNTLNSLKQQLETIKLKIRVLEWRLEKDICYGNEDFDSTLLQYENYGEGLANYNNTYDVDENSYMKKESNDFRHKEKVEYQSTLSEYKLAKYRIENNISSKSTASDLIQSLFTSGGDGFIFIIIIALMLTGGVVSEEFNKGTIKLLLIRPYSRRKILASKIIACLIALIISLLIMTIIETLIAGIMYGFNTLSTPALLYNYNTNSVVSMNCFAYMLINLLQISPLIIILALVAFMIGTICANTAVAIVVSFLIYFVSSIINSLATQFQVKWLKIIPTLNWDLTQYAYGGLSTIEGMSVGFSIVICAITIITMLVITFENFARKNIKNV